MEIDDLVPDLPFTHFRHLSFATDNSQSQCKSNRVNKWKEDGFIRKQDLLAGRKERGMVTLFLNFAP